MVHWSVMQRTPEEVWWQWTPDRWFLPWRMIAVQAGFLLLGLLPLLLLIELPRHADRAAPIGLLTLLALGTLSGHLSHLSRQFRLRRMTGKYGPDDWVCASCLHAEHHAPEKS